MPRNSIIFGKVSCKFHIEICLLLRALEKNIVDSSSSFHIGCMRLIFDLIDLNEWRKKIQNIDAQALVKEPCGEFLI
jgi:hypothetical protein